MHRAYRIYVLKQIRDVMIIFTVEQKHEVGNMSEERSTVLVQRKDAVRSLFEANMKQIKMIDFKVTV